MLLLQGITLTLYKLNPSDEQTNLFFLLMSLLLLNCNQSTVADEI